MFPKIGKGKKKCPQCDKVITAFTPQCICGWAFKKKKKKVKKKVKKNIIVIPESDLPLFFSIKDFMKHKLEFCKEFINKFPDEEAGAAEYLKYCIQKNPKAVISMIRLITGISNDKWKEFILQGLSRDSESQELCHYEVWPKYVRGLNSGLPRAELDDLEKYIKDNSILACGIVNLFLKGANLKIATKDFWCLGDCKFHMLKDFKKHSDEWQCRILRDRLAGSYDEISGMYREKFCKDLLSDYAKSVQRLDVLIGKSFDRKELPFYSNLGTGTGRIKSEDLFPKLTGQDVIAVTLSGDKILGVEISIQRGTGSGITSKSRSINHGLARYKRKYPDTLFGIVVGGYGWMSRQADLRTIIKNMDQVWYYTSDGLAEMLMDFAIKIGFPIAKKDAVDKVIAKHQEFCQEETWKKYCRLTEEPRLDENEDI